MAATVDNTITKPSATIEAPPAVTRPPRLESLDVFRGLTIAGMIVVNDPGTWSAMHWPLAHADELMSDHPVGLYPGKAWVDANGWTPTDLIFPFFLFIVGVSMVLSFAARQERGASRRDLFKHAARRSALILLIGWFIHLQPYFNFARMRFPGVLPRIAVVYLCASAITLVAARRGRIAWIIGLLVSYYAALRLIPVPGCDASGWMTQHCSLAGWLDRTLMHGHIYRTDFDPEGLLSTLPAIATTLLGTLTGEFLRDAKTSQRRIRGLAIAGVVGCVAGYAWHPFFPIYKPLWTSSYVLFTAGAACLLLALCSWLIDLHGWRKWDGPFLWLGANAILIFALSSFAAKAGFIFKVSEGTHEIGVQSWIYNHWFAPLAEPKIASLAFALSFLALWIALAWWLHRKKIFVKV
jgi:predicted acyltransferase